MTPLQQTAETANELPPPSPVTSNNSSSRQMENDDVNDDDDFEEELYLRDPELFRITEQNRQIGTTAEELTAAAAGGGGGSLERFQDDNSKSNSERQLQLSRYLMFSDPLIRKQVVKENALIETFYYGLLSPSCSSDLTVDKRAAEHVLKVPKRRAKQYMFMCDFREESMHALRWGVGTLLKDGDLMHVVNIVNMSEEIIASGSKSTKREQEQERKKRLRVALDQHSKTMISNVRKILGEMMLYNIEINVYSAVGKPRHCLLEWIQSVPNLTMVVCGARELGAIKGMLLGSTSTFLVQNSPVPVTVVRSGKKKQKLTAAQKLSRRISSQLTVEESPNGRKSLPPTLNTFDGSVFD